MTQIQVNIYEGQRFLTTNQLAESYETNKDRISANFNENAERFKVGKQFFLLQGEDLKEFKNEPRNSGLVGKNASTLYLWTEKGAWLHAKSLNTDAAWDAYELLVDEYYRIIEQPQVFTAEQQRREHLKLSIETSERLDNIEVKLAGVINTMRIDGVQQRNLQQQGAIKVLKSLGGKESAAYSKISRKLFKAIWGEFNKYFNIPRYGELHKVKYEEGLKFISMWQPSTSLKLEIEQYNRQTQLKLIK